MTLTAGRSRATPKAARICLKCGAPIELPRAADVVGAAAGRPAGPRGPRSDRRGGGGGRGATGRVGRQRPSRALRDATGARTTPDGATPRRG